jgi:hypothetical protein
VKTVETEDGSKTGPAAFRRLRLQDNEQLAGKAESKTGEITGHKELLAGGIKIKKAARMGSLVLLELKHYLVHSFC